MEKKKFFTAQGKTEQARCALLVVISMRLAMFRIKKTIKILVVVLLSVLGLFLIFVFSVTTLDDSLSRSLRESTETHINRYMEQLVTRAELSELKFLDRAVLHTGVVSGVVLTHFVYPEASMLLWHYVYGDGSDLELPSAYFQKSSYLTGKISQYGEGEHGPIGLKQSDDWRMSLALNPYYLSIADKSVKIFHPSIRFASPQGERVWTSVPLGKLTIRVYDNLVSVMDPTPFYVYSEWSLEQ